MKVDILDAYDRYKVLVKQDTAQNIDIAKCCQNLIDQRPFGDHSFYIFAHTRTDDDGVTKRLIWQPRLTKPKAESNSMLFRVYPGSDEIKIYWMIPARELWGQFNKGNLTQSQIVVESIYDYQHHRQKLDKKEEEDLDDATIDQIYREISIEGRRKKHEAKQATSVASSVLI